MNTYHEAISEAISLGFFSHLRQAVVKMLIAKSIMPVFLEAQYIKCNVVIKDKPYQRARKLVLKPSVKLSNQ